MKFLVPDFHELTVDIPSFIYLVDCDFLFSDCDSEFCNSAYKCCVDICNAHLSFGVYAASLKYEKICPGLLHQ